MPREEDLIYDDERAALDALKTQQSDSRLVALLESRLRESRVELMSTRDAFARCRPPELNAYPATG